MKKNQNKVIEIFQPEKQLLKNILFTIAYYNTLNYQPTSFFIWKYFIQFNKSKKQKYSLKDILKSLKMLEDNKKVYQHNGFWSILMQDDSLNKQVEEYKIQIQKNKISTEKNKQIFKWAQTIKWLPYIREVFLTGTLAMKRGGVGSDWDVLVVTKKNRIWLGRMIITTWLQLIGKRRHGNKIQDRFCLNQFLAENKLKFQEKNEFSANEIIVSRALLGNFKLQNNFFAENKNWLAKIKPNFTIKKYSETCTKIKMTRSIIEKILEASNLGDRLNKIIKKVMIVKIINNPKTYTKEADIRYSDFFLVFLPYPQRDKIRKKTLGLLTKLT